MAHRHGIPGAPLIWLLAAIACSATPFPGPAATTDSSREQTATLAPTEDAPAIQPTAAPKQRQQAMRAGFEQDIASFLDGLHYWLDVRVDLDPVRVRGRQRVHYVNTSNDTLTEVAFRLVANGLYSKTLHTVTNVTVDGQPAETALSVHNSVLMVKLGKELAPGASVEIAMDSILDLPPGAELSYGRIADKGEAIFLSSFFPMVSVYEHGAWWVDPTVDQGDPAYSESALFDVTLTAPEGVMVAASGSVISQTPGDAGTTVYQFVSGPIRDFSVALSPKFELDTQSQDGVTVNIWSRPGDEKSDVFAMGKTLKSLELFGRLYGKYPFAELDVVEAPIEALGIEYPGLIYIDSDAWNASESNLFEFVLSHEIAHQWWYSAIGNDQINEPWLDEGLADYSIIVYFRDGYDQAAGDRVRDFYQRDVDDYVSNNDSRMPTGLPAGAYSANEYGTFVYSAGALFYSHLEDDYGKDKVTQMLRAYYARHRYGLARIDDMRDIVVEFFGDKAGAFFDEWVRGK